MGRKESSAIIHKARNDAHAMQIVPAMSEECPRLEDLSVIDRVIERMSNIDKVRIIRNAFENDKKDYGEEVHASSSFDKYIKNLNADEFMCNLAEEMKDILICEVLSYLRGVR
jgi:hypothetical protein